MVRLMSLRSTWEMVPAPFHPYRARTPALLEMVMKKFPATSVSSAQSPVITYRRLTARIRLPVSRAR